VNRALAIILVPAILVAAGYVLVFRYVGIEPAYGRMIATGALLFALLWWLGKRGKSKREPERASR
jgi:hypothetical protein